MPLDAWITLAVIVVLCGVFVTERLAPSLAMGGAVAVLYLVGVVDAPQAFTGFSNPAPITVAALYVLAGAADLTGALSGLSGRMLGDGRARSERAALSRIVFPMTGASGFVANTPLVAMLAPRVAAWARRTGQSPSRFLLPLSYAAVLGGVITVLGTSTNLVVSGLLQDQGLRPLDVFEITRLGLPVALAGGLVLVVVAPRLLPTRATPDQDLDNVREFTVELLVSPGGALVGRSVMEGSLRNLQGVYLIEIRRHDRVIAPVPPDETLEGDDRLVFAGNVERIIDLQSLPGLVMAEEHHFAADNQIGHQFYEVVVGEGSPLNGSTMKDTSFRTRYGAAVMAVHRAGERLGGKLGDARLRAGDVLLVVAEPAFTEAMRDRPDFSVIAPLDGRAPLRRRSARLVELVTLAFVVVAGTGLVDLTRAAVGTALALMVLRAMTPNEARRSVNIDVILMIAFSFGLGAAAAESGLAQELADGLVSVTERWGDLGVLAGILLATMLATELLSNNAAAAVVFPIAVATAAQTGLDPRPLAIGVLIMASCSFLSPIGYQTNTMVFGMGGYRFLDFTRLGFPLSICCFLVTMLVLPVAFPLR
jgi:di/tricarboxylate transporter